MELGLAQEAAQNWPNFGILLGKQKGGEDDGDGATIGQSLVVAQIERGSPADKLAKMAITWIYYIFEDAVFCKLATEFFA
jgi:hypothetical protein